MSSFADDVLYLILPYVHLSNLPSFLRVNKKWHNILKQYELSIWEQFYCGHVKLSVQMLEREIAELNKDTTASSNSGAAKRKKQTLNKKKSDLQSATKQLKAAQDFCTKHKEEPLKLKDKCMDMVRTQRLNFVMQKIANFMAENSGRMELGHNAEGLRHKWQGAIDTLFKPLIIDSFFYVDSFDGIFRLFMDVPHTGMWKVTPLEEFITDTFACLVCTLFVCS